MSVKDGNYHRAGRKVRLIHKYEMKNLEDFDNDQDQSSVLDNLPDIKVIKRKFRASMESSESARELCALDRGYYDGTRSIGEEWKKFLRKHRLISPNINKIRRNVSGEIGIQLQHPTDPQCWPRTPDAQGAADIATKSLRYAADTAKFNKIKGECLENFYIEGYTAIKITPTADEMIVDKIHPNELFWDPHSREYDFRDARYLGIARWVTEDEIFEIYPDAKQFGDIRPGDLLGADARTMRDAPEIWINIEDQRTRVVEMYYLEGGQWKMVAFCHAGVLDFGPSPLHDDKGNSICPIVATSCYVNQDVDNDDMTFARYGVVRDMIGPQDEYNAHRASMVKAAVDTRVQQVDVNAPPVSADTAREEARRPDGAIPLGWTMVQSRNFPEQAQLLQLSSAELDRMAPTPAVLGRNLGDETSGRSRLVQQQAGLTESGPMIERIENWTQLAYETMWHAMREYWTEQMFVQVSGNQKAPEFLLINEPIVEMRTMPVTGPDGQPVIDPMTGHPEMRPMAVTVGTKNELASMNMRIIISSIASNATLEHEQKAALLDLIGRGVPVGSPEFILALKLFPFPGKTDIEEAIASFTAQQQEAQAGQQQEQAQAALVAQQLAAQEQQAKTENLAASAQKHIAEAQRTSVEAEQMSHAGGLEEMLKAYGFQRLQ